jgi:hypothetical protein
VEGNIFFLNIKYYKGEGRKGGREEKIDWGKHFFWKIGKKVVESA